MKQLIVNADDFGLDPAINAAVARAHTDGILTSASLMVAAPHVEEAVAFAKAHPRLGVGVHLCLVQSRAAASVEKIPSLVGSSGELPHSPFALSARITFDRRMLADIETELRTQVALFLATGLRPSHLDAHLHTHIDPRILRIVIRLAHEHRIAFVRAPFESIRPSFRCAFSRLPRKFARLAVFGPMGLRTKLVLRHAGLRTADVVFGALDPGHVTGNFVQSCIRKLRAGISEIFFHPAADSTPALRRIQPGYEHRAELGTLCSAEVRGVLESGNVRLVNFHEVE